MATVRISEFICFIAARAVSFCLHDPAMIATAEEIHFLK
jgi:hypothetical protein